MLLVFKVGLLPFHVVQNEIKFWNFFNHVQILEQFFTFYFVIQAKKIMI